MAPSLRLVVTAAVVAHGDAFLVTRRPRGAHLEGFWEFPGGKCDAGETLEACLRREIREELDCGSAVHEEIYSVTHAYDDRIVELHFFRCTLDGAPRPLLGQEMQWVARRDLRSLSFPPADAELIALLEKGLGPIPRSSPAR
ncbi:MAG TPA: (deoxy)nucleoside triphosphate pyrophosphohydrolase [Vicinamibacterales bacterium]|nr:(deoxy)nucleoside triphosphate pyrophosphohydrolase [Vicinamibacterales bacterium]